MTQIIDVIGSSGVGKTAIVNALSSYVLSNKKYRLVCDTHVLRRVRPWVPKHIRSLVQQWNFSTQPTSKIFRLQWLFFTMPEGIEYWKALERATPDRIKLLEFAISLTQLIDRPVQYRIKGLQFFLNTFEQRMLIEESLLTDLVVISDEPLSYRPSLFSINGDCDQKKLIKEYYKLLPLPAALIFLDASTECILERIQKRANNGGKYAIRHQGKNTRALVKDIDNSRKFAKTVSLTLVARGVPVVQIDAEDSIIKNQRKALEFIDTLNI